MAPVCTRPYLASLPSPVGRTHVKSETQLRVWLSVFWTVSLLVYLRWWEATIRVPAIMVWTLAYTSLYVTTGFALFRRAVSTHRHDVWHPAALWMGVVLLVALSYALFPSVSVRGQVVQSVGFVNMMDVVFPIWIMGRGVALTWDSTLVRALIFTGGTALLLIGLWAYMIPMPGTSFSGPLRPLTAEEQESRSRLETHVRALAEEIGERNDGAEETFGALERAASYIESEFASLEYEVAMQDYEIEGRTLRNVEVELVGERSPEEIIVVGGHYDSVEGAPGADDNASGTAAVLELARMFRGERFARTIRFVAFSTEEPPHFDSPRMGSRQYAARAAQRGERVLAMISLETIGYFADDRGTQRYPPPFNLFYPDRGNFIGFVGNLASRSLVRRAIAVFRSVAAVPSEGVASPSWIPGVNWSDHASFWVHGYRAIMITDTAPFRNPHYHTSEDTPDKLDFDRMARVVAGVAHVIRDLAEPDPS